MVSTGGSTKTKHFTYNIDHVNPVNIYETEIQFSIETNQEKCTAQIEIAAIAERDTIKADKWESDDGIGTTFPFRIEELIVDNEISTEQLTTSESGRVYAEKLHIPESINHVYSQSDCEKSGSTNPNEGSNE